MGLMDLDGTELLRGMRFGETIIFGYHILNSGRRIQPLQARAIWQNHIQESTDSDKIKLLLEKVDDAEEKDVDRFLAGTYVNVTGEEIPNYIHGSTDKIAFREG